MIFELNIELNIFFNIINHFTMMLLILPDFLLQIKDNLFNLFMNVPLISNRMKTAFDRF